MKKITIFLSITFLILILPTFIKSLRVDFINYGGYGPSFSESMEEAIEREVFIADLKVVSFRTQGDSVNFAIEEGWIEKIWSRGTWYWTTKVHSTGYQIVMHTAMEENEVSTLNLVKVSAIDNSESIGCVMGICIGQLRSLPATDTLKYNLMKEHKLHFADSNVIGKLMLVVNRTTP